MSGIEVVAPGALTTVQDLGRPGFGPIGISPSGAADRVSLRLGNKLVGNADGAAAIEMTLTGGTFHFVQAAVAALTGSDFGARLDEAAVEPGTSFQIRPGQTLRLGATLSGARSYLCVRGGISVPMVLGSASTQLLGGFGGYQGRPLRERDVLKIGGSDGSYQPRRIAPRVLASLSQSTRLRVTAGPQASFFSEAAMQAFYGGAYRVGEQSNRMGLRLDGPRLEERGGGMITEGVSLGAVQVPPEGLPIILFVEQQTTGGYPKIANVISADLHRLGQLRPRDEVRFEEVSFETARALLIEQERLLASPEIILNEAD
jgi:antagonist of KipI